MNLKDCPLPGKELLSTVRAGFVEQGTSFSQWCEQNQITRQNARVCLLGGWDGPKAQALRSQILKASKAKK